jgi:predicted  nucleic acid-binding Zn-ribbon protein
MKDFLKKLWQWLLDQTDIDEMIEAEVEEVKKEYKETKAKIKEVKDEVEHRVERVKEEVKDVVETAQKVKSQIDDIKGAVKGEVRKGRKPSTKKPKVKKN